MADTKSDARSDVNNGLSPHLVIAGAAEAIEFYKRAFGAQEMIRLPAPDGKLMHAAVRINGSMVMLVDENVGCGMLSPKTLKGTPVTIHLMVDDVDAFVERAVKAGATVTMPVADMFWGDRFGVIEDPFGHHWSIATHLRDMSAQEILQASRGAMGGRAESIGERRPGMTDDQAQIRALLDDFAGAIRNKDAAGAIATLADDAVGFDLAPPLRMGPEAIHDPAGLEEWFGTWESPIVSESHDLKVAVGGDVAYAYGLQHMSGIKTGGVAVDLWFRATACFHREAGRWRITHMHNSVPFAMDGSGNALLDLRPLTPSI